METPLSPGLTLLRGLLRLIRNIDGRLSGIASKLFPSEYRIEGTCKKRGVCCHQIAIHLSKEFWEIDQLRRWSQKYYEFVYNFRLIREESDMNVQVFRCNYVKADGQCGIYSKRPAICRNYPQPRYFGRPTFLPGCGYTAVKNKP